MEHKLIAVVGNTPQVMTETLWALRVQCSVPIDEVFVMTTTMGKATCQQRLLDEGRFEKMLVDYDIDPKVKFDADHDHIRVFKDAEGNFLDDIRTSEENRLARDQLFRWIEDWTQKDHVALHCSLAGGRKSMGYLLGAAIQFFGRHKIACIMCWLHHQRLKRIAIFSSHLFVKSKSSHQTGNAFLLLMCVLSWQSYPMYR